MNPQRIEQSAHQHHAKLLRNASIVTVGLSTLMLCGCGHRTNYNYNAVTKRPTVRFRSASRIKAEHTDLRNVFYDRSFTSPQLVKLLVNRDRIVQDSDLVLDSKKPNVNADFILDPHNDMLTVRPSVKESSTESWNAPFNDTATGTTDLITYDLTPHTLSFKLKSPDILNVNTVRSVKYQLHSIADNVSGKKSEKLTFYPIQFSLGKHPAHMYKLKPAEQKRYALTVVAYYKAKIRKHSKVMRFSYSHHKKSSSLKPGEILPKKR